MKKFYVILLVILGTISLSAVNCNVSSSSSQQDDGAPEVVSSCLKSPELTPNPLKWAPATY